MGIRALTLVTFSRSVGVVKAIDGPEEPKKPDPPEHTEVIPLSEAPAVPLDAEEQNRMAKFRPSQKVIVIIKNGVLLFLIATLAISLFKTLRKFLSPRAKRKRTVNKNRELVEALVAYLPEKREELTEKAAWMIRMKTGFTPTEVFRKYLWFVLRERKFDQSAVDDLIRLKHALKLTDAEIGTALKERAQRIYDKYGSLMLNTEGLTSAGVERKATCKALFSKVLYLTEHDPLLSQESEAAKERSLQEIFGATEDDMSQLRIVSLEDIDLDKLDRMIEDSGDQEETDEDDDEDHATETTDDGV